MAITREVVDGEIRVTRRADPVIETLTKRELVGKVAEVQTKIDHLQTDLAALIVERTDLESDVAAIAAAVRV